MGKMALIQRIRTAFGDPLLVVLIVALALFGVAMVYSAGQLDVPNPLVENVWKMQLVWLGLSVVALLIVLRIQVRWFEWMAIPAYSVGLILLR